MTDHDRRLSDAQAARGRAIAELGLTRPEAALFNVIHYGLTTPPSDLPCRAELEDYNLTRPVATEAECRVALEGCLARGWLQVIDEPGRQRIADELRKEGVLGPIYGGLPDVGCVDFTDAGADLWHRLTDRLWPDRAPFAYTDCVHEKTARFFRTREAASGAIQKHLAEEDVVAATGPTPIGPWRAQWWRRFPEGYRIDIEERWQWKGRCGRGGEDTYLDYSSQSTESGRLTHVLGCHKVTLAEWLVLASMESEWCRNSARLHREAAEAGRRLGVTLSEEQCRDGLEACLRHGWLRVVDQGAADEVRSLLDADPAVLVVPRTARDRPYEWYYVLDPNGSGNRIPMPVPARYYLGELDFSPAGAALYRTISADCLGPDWEDALHVSRVYYWEEHHYCTSEDGLKEIAEGHVVKGHVVRRSRVVPIGPWCVYWWERFPSGYRLELQLGEP